MCTSPSILYTEGQVNPKTGKLIYHFKGFNAETLRNFRHFKERYKLNYNYFLVPCGKCIECRLQYRREWAIRLLNELKTSDNAYFLTITYNDDNLPLSKSLNKDDIVRFMKSLYKAIYRYYKDRNIKTYKDFKYFACGEYGGDINQLIKGDLDKCRPHYHAIVFNVPFGDFTEHIKNDEGKIIHKKSHSGEILLQSEILDHIWSKGYILAGKVSFNSCSYVAGYVQKKMYGDDSIIYTKNLINPPFMICSKGIGKSYFLENKDVLTKTDEVFYMKNGKMRKSSLPRYYLKLLERNDLIDFSYLKFMRNKKNNFTDLIIDSDYKTIKEYFVNRRLTNKLKEKRLIRK